ncbi:MAG: Mov34/MPN/PAD-1 family protein [Candidatus Binatia bacterium]
MHYATESCKTISPRRTELEFTLSLNARNEIELHAIASFPEECCGVVISRSGGDVVERCRNIQNLIHAEDPAGNPRDATIAYAMDPQELMTILNAAETSGGKLKAFYHSHPNHEAYFSEEDKAGATPFGEPTYPEAAQIVISIYDSTVKRVRAYMWKPERKDFVEVPLTKDIS